MAKIEIKGLKVCKRDSHLLEFKGLFVYSFPVTEMYLNLDACF